MPEGLRHDARRRRVCCADLFWVPVLTGIPILGVALLASLFHEPWLFAGLGPSAFIHAYTPERADAKFYNTVVGHITGITAGWVTVEFFRESHLFSGTILSSSEWMAVSAVTLTVLGQLLLNAYHAPAASTALLFALGAVSSTGLAARRLAIGAFLLATLSVGVRYIRLRQIARREEGN